MRVHSSGSVPRIDLGPVHRLVGSAWALWRGLRFDAHGHVLDPDTGETSALLQLTSGRHRMPGARYLIVAGGAPPTAFTLAADDGRRLSGTLAGRSWHADLELGAAWRADVTVDVRATLEGNQVSPRVIGLAGGGPATGHVTFDPQVLGGHGPLLGGVVTAERVRARGSVTVRSRHDTWEGRIVAHLHGRGVLGGLALLLGRPFVRRAATEAMRDFWRDAAAECARLAAEVGSLDHRVAAAGGAERWLHEQFWQVLRAAAPGTAAAAAVPAAASTTTPSAPPADIAPLGPLAKHGLTRRYRRRVELVPAQVPPRGPGEPLLLDVRDGARVTARRPTTSRYRTPPRFRGRVEQRAGGPVLVGEIRESMGNVMYYRVYRFTTLLMIAVAVLGIVTTAHSGFGQGGAPLLIGVIAAPISGLLWLVFRSSRRSDHLSDEQSLVSGLRTWLADPAVRARR